MQLPDLSNLSGKSNGKPPHVVLAIDHDRCAKNLDDSPRVKLPLKSIVKQLESYDADSVMIVSFSNRQTDKIQEMLNGNSITHLQTIKALFSNSSELTFEVDTNYYGGPAYAKITSKQELTAYEEMDRKQTLATSIMNAYPEASHFLFVDDKYELLPAPTDRIDVL